MNDASLIDMARELKSMAIKPEPQPCTICTPEYVCWYHRSFEERVVAKGCGTTIFANGFEEAK